MKKSIIVIICLCLLFGITGCSSTSNTNTSNEKNISNNISNFKDSLSKNINSNGAVTKKGKLIVFVENKNDVNVDMKIEVEFYDENNNIIGNDSEEINAVGSNSKIAIDMYSTPDKFDNYKIFIDAKETTDISYFDKIEIKHNSSGNAIAVQAINNSNEDIEYIGTSIVFYKDNNVIGYDDGIKDNIAPTRSANFTFNYPTDKKYQKVEFDNYEIFLTYAISYNY